MAKICQQQSAGGCRHQEQARYRTLVEQPHCRQCQPPRAMMAAQNRIMTMPANSPWMIERTSLILLASTAGTCPAFTALRHDRNSSVGTIDRSARMMKTANFVRKAWLEK